MAIAEVSVVPIGTGSTSVSSYVAECVKVLESMGLTYELQSMGTTIEGSLSDILEAVRRMHECVFDTGPQRVYSVIKIDDRRDSSSDARQKVLSVQGKL